MRCLPLALLALLAVSACAEGEQEVPMPERLAAAAEASDRVENLYANRARAAAFARLLEDETGPAQRLNLRFQRSVEELRAGASEAAVQELRAIYHDIAEAPFLSEAQKHSLVRQIYPYLGLAYLRVGEQENCLDGHTAASCIFPIRAAGVYERTRGPEAALTIYGNLLEREPDHLTARWLLNLAYMNLGRYPEDVPPTWLLPLELFNSEHALLPFTDVAPAVGLDVNSRAGGGVTDDFDGDGLLDVMVSSWGPRDPLRLFRNRGDGRFEERTTEAGLDGLTGGLNLIQADYDNDGDTDVLVLRGAWLGTSGAHPNSLLQNNGSGTFTDVTEAAGLLSFHPTQTAVWQDFNGDGHLDLFIGNETSDPSASHPCELYLSRGDGTFRDAATEAGMDVRAFVKGVASADYDRDGRPDLFLSIYGDSNRLFRNLGPGPNGVPRFADVTDQASVAEPHLSFPTWFFDYDQDGWDDLFVADYELDPEVPVTHHVVAAYLGEPTRRATARLYRNRGDGTFTDVSAEVGLDQVTQAMGVGYGDLDGDGWLDMYLGTGDPQMGSLIPNRMFRNDGGRRFQDVTSAGGFGHLQKGHAVSFADLDNDGDQDVHAVMGGAYEGDLYPNVLFENPYDGRHRWTRLELVGTRANRSAIGSRVRIVAGDRILYRTVGSGGSFGAGPLRLEIGLGTATRIDTLDVRWAGSGTVQRFMDVPVDQRLRIVEGKPEWETLPAQTFEFAEEAPLHAHGEHGTAESDR